MNVRVAKLWVEALRSGKYKQTCGRLKKGDCFCALGVLIQLFLRERKKGWGTLAHDATLPPVVQKWAGLDSPDPKFIDKDGRPQSCTWLNDNSKLTFAELANLIEAKYVKNAAA